MTQQLSFNINPESPIVITKMSGTGNDFIIIDHRQPFIPKKMQPEFARLICRRKFSAGADGLILIEDSPEVDFQWQFYNADGSVAEMCGNGARCAARFAYTKKIAPTTMRFKTLAGVIEAEMTGDDVIRLKMTPPQDISLEEWVVLDGNKQKIGSINTGVPHVVCFVDDLKSVPLEQWGRTIRNHALFEPAGTNVNFGQIVNEHEIHVRTYERGVEGETLACGTGAVAAAIMAGLFGQAVSPVKITTAGGEQLTIYFSIATPGGEIAGVYLEGPANFVYEGQLHPESLQE